MRKSNKVKKIARCSKVKYVFLFRLTVSMYKSSFNQVVDLHNEFPK